MIREALRSLTEGRDLGADEAAAAMDEILSGGATPSQIAGFAVALRMKGETVSEVAALARAMRARAGFLPLDGMSREDLLDTCGTGGDGAGTFNVSTVVAFVACGAGARVAKHGNRAVSSQAGSADVLEALGVSLDLTAEECARCLSETGVAFLFAPQFHSALRHAAAPRREMGIRTVFNVLGPLCNPAGAGRQLVGVYEDRWVLRLAQVLRELGSRSACVVHSADGLDELSVFAPFHLAWLSEDGKVRESIVDPAALRMAHDDRERARGSDPAANAQLLERVLDGEPGAARDLVLLNAAAALQVAGLATGFTEGLERARESIDSGRARACLDAFVAFSRRCRAEAPERTPE